MGQAAATALLLRLLLASLLVAQGACQVLGDVFLYVSTPCIRVWHLGRTRWPAAPSANRVAANRASFRTVHAAGGR